MEDYRSVIISDSNIKFKKPWFHSTRISVNEVLSFLASGMLIEEIITDFHELTEADIRTCWAYAATD